MRVKFKKCRLKVGIVLAIIYRREIDIFFRRPAVADLRAAVSVRNRRLELSAKVDSRNDVSIHRVWTGSGVIVESRGNANHVSTCQTERSVPVYPFRDIAADINVD